MELTTFQQTDSLQSNTYPKFKIYNNNIYYLWNKRDTDNVTQVWFATSNLDGSEFVEIQLTNGSKSMDKPELYIYNNIIYITWYGVSVEGGRYQVWITSMNLDASDFKVLHITNHITGAKDPKIVVKNDVIYLAYEMGRYDATRYHHMVRAKLNIDGTEFYETAASSSPNEVVRNVELFISDDPNDNKIYYIWTRNYFIDDPPSLNIYSADMELQNFTNVMIIIKASSGNLYVKDDKIYFAWVSYINSKGICSVVNIDGTGYEDLLANDERGYSLLQVTNDTIDFAISNRTSASFPISAYKILSASLNLNTLDYSETELVSEITISFNDSINLQFIRNNDILYYIWQQYDINNKYQIWFGILSKDICDGVVCDNICIGYDLWSQKCDPATGTCVTDQFLESQSELCDYESSNLWLYLLLLLPPAVLVTMRVIGKSKERKYR